MKEFTDVDLALIVTGLRAISVIDVQVQHEKLLRKVEEELSTRGLRVSNPSNPVQPPRSKPDER